MEKTEKEPRGFYVEKGSFFAHASVTLLVLSMAARLLGTMSLWGDMPKLIVQVLLPVGCSLLFIIFILLFGRIALWTTILPVLGGAAFFILSTFDKGPGLPLFVCIALAFLASFIYTATLSGMIRTKWLLALILALVFAYQVAFPARDFFGGTQDPGFYEGMTLLSSLAMVLAMLLASLAFRRKKKAKAVQELPEIKDTAAVPPEPAVNAEAPMNTQETSPETNEETSHAEAAGAEQAFEPAAVDETSDIAGEAIEPKENDQE